MTLEVHSVEVLDLAKQRQVEADDVADELGLADEPLDGVGR